MYAFFLHLFHLDILFWDPPPTAFHNLSEDNSSTTWLNKFNGTKGFLAGRKDYSNPIWFPPPFLLLCLCCHQKLEPLLITSHFALLVFLTGSNSTHTVCFWRSLARQLLYNSLYCIYMKLHTLCRNKIAFKQPATLWSLCNRFKYLDLMHCFQKFGDLTCCLFNYTHVPGCKRAAKICFRN